MEYAIREDLFSIMLIWLLFFLKRVRFGSLMVGFYCDLNSECARKRVFVCFYLFVVSRLRYGWFDFRVWRPGIWFVECDLVKNVKDFGGTVFSFDIWCLTNIRDAIVPVWLFPICDKYHWQNISRLWFYLWHYFCSLKFYIYILTCNKKYINNFFICNKSSVGTRCSIPLERPRISFYDHFDSIK